MRPISSEIKSRAGRRRFRTGSFDAVIDTTAFAAGVVALEQNMDGFNRDAIKRLHEEGRANLKRSILRPQEHGSRPDERMTGRFTFGGESSAFVGRTFSEGDTQGFGWPDIAHADRVTNYVWRSLEWGLGAYRESHEFAPKRGFRMPQGRWHPVGGGDVFMPKTRAYPVPDSGIRAKHFLTDAWQSVVVSPSGYVQRGYEQISRDVARAFRGQVRANH